MKIFYLPTKANCEGWLPKGTKQEEEEMRKALMFMLIAVLSIFCLSCKKEIQEEQVNIDVRTFYENTNVGSTASLHCIEIVDAMEILEKLTRNDKVELKVRLDITKTCRRSDDNSLAAQIARGAESFTGLHPGKKFYQQCLQMTYEIFDEGFKLRNIGIDENCPESELFKFQKKGKLQDLLWVAAYAGTTCKDSRVNQCDGDSISNRTSNIKILRYIDLNTDGIDELLLGDYTEEIGAGPRAGLTIHHNKLWAIINGAPTLILEDEITEDDLARSNWKQLQGFQPITHTFGSITGQDETITYVFDTRQNRYIAR